MKLLLSILSFIILIQLTVNSQTLIWDEDFQGGGANWDITIQSGFNADEANVWVLNDDEGGVAPPGCGVASNGNNTLHVSCAPAICGIVGASGAAYFSGDQTFGLYDATTDIRAAYTQAISTAGQTNLEFRFDWIGVGQLNVDYAELEYSIDGGTTWTAVWTQTPGNVCGSGQGEWAEEIVPLPAALENQADVRFAYRWVNNNDELGSDPSFAVNNLRLFADAAGGVPSASFTASSTDICEEDCISFTDNSTGTNISSWDWNFGGGATPNTSTDQNPSNICFDNEGVYTITLTVTDDNGTNSTDISINVADCSGGPNASFTASDLNPCDGDCISFTDNSTGDNVSAWSWDFGGGATPNTSTDQNPSNICFDNVGNFTVSLTVTDNNGTSTTEQTITVADCSGGGGNPPNANFTYDGDLCQGNCLDFEDLSSGNPTAWEWNFDGATPATSTEQNPSNICFDNPGQYNVTLTATNSAGTSTFTFPININPTPGIVAFGDTTIDVGGMAILNAEVFGPGDLNWTPSNSLNCDDCFEVEADPVITTTYTVSITDNNGCTGTAQVTVIVEVEDIIGVPSAFSPNNDGTNDVLRVLGVGIQSMDFRIFNRYGQLVFETTDQDEGWDGTFKGDRLNQGVFAYTLEYTLVNGVSGKKEGSVTLVK